MAVDVPTWGEFKKYLRQLQDEDVKQTFSTITIDTIGIAYDRCEAYICDRENVDRIGDIPYGAGYKMVDKEFDDCIRKITQLGYGMVLIGHAKTRIESDGQTSVKHVSPDIPERCAKIINRMVDLTAYIGMEDNGTRYIYPRQVVLEEGQQKTEIEAGSHFAYLNDKIELGYEPLVNAIADAMEKDAGTNNFKMTDAPVQVAQEVKLDFGAIMSRIREIAIRFHTMDESSENPHYTSDYRKIVENYLGKGRGVKDCDESQVEHLGLILEDLEAYVKDNNLTI